MKVLMLPYSRNNPYQRELTVALEKYGVDVTLCNFSVLPLLRAVWVCGKPDILHLHWTDGFIVARNWPKTILKTLRFLIELLVVKALGVKVVWTVHNLSNHEKIKSSYESFVNRLLIHLYDQVIVHCSSSQKVVIRTFRLTDRLNDRVHVIPHGHYLDSYENRITRQDARVSLDYKEDTVLFLFFGNIRPYKGLFELIDAFHMIENPKAELLIVGKPLNDIIKEDLLNRCQADNRIRTCLQYVLENEIQIYMNAADVVIFPYTDILTSGTVLLAMSFGKAIVVPNIGCIPETLDIQGGFLYDPNDVNGLSRALKNVLSSDLVAMGRHNRIKVENFGWDEIAKMTIKVYYRSGGGEIKT
jgi:glycosyltransferase involved in cell wall biosynthesis